MKSALNLIVSRHARVKDYPGNIKSNAFRNKVFIWPEAGTGKTNFVRFNFKSISEEAVHSQKMCFVQGEVCSEFFPCWAPRPPNPTTTRQYTLSRSVAVLRT